MTCSDEELKARMLQARELGMHQGVDFAFFPGCSPYSCVLLPTLVVYVGGARYGPFTTVEEAANTLTLLGGRPEMTCSDRELWQRADQARRLGAHAGGLFAYYRIRQGFVDLTLLTVRRGGCLYGPFTTVEEALNMLILLGGGPK